MMLDAIQCLLKTYWDYVIASVTSQKLRCSKDVSVRNFIEYSGEKTLFGR
jgi:hypothetical protein